MKQAGLEAAAERRQHNNNNNRWRQQQHRTWRAGQQVARVDLRAGARKGAKSEWSRVGGGGGLESAEWRPKWKSKAAGEKSSLGPQELRRDGMTVATTAPPADRRTRKLMELRQQVALARV